MSLSPTPILPHSRPCQQRPSSPTCLRPRSSGRRGSAGRRDSTSEPREREGDVRQAQPEPERTLAITSPITQRSRPGAVATATGGPSSRYGKENCLLKPRAHLSRCPNSSVRPPPLARWPATPTKPLPADSGAPFGTPPTSRLLSRRAGIG